MIIQKKLVKYIVVQNEFDHLPHNNCLGGRISLKTNEFLKNFYIDFFDNFFNIWMVIGWYLYILQKRKFFGQML